MGKKEKILLKKNPCKKYFGRKENLCLKKSLKKFTGRKEKFP